MKSLKLQHKAVIPKIGGFESAVKIPNPVIHTVIITVIKSWFTQSVYAE